MNICWAPVLLLWFPYCPICRASCEQTAFSWPPLHGLPHLWRAAWSRDVTVSQGSPFPMTDYCISISASCFLPIFITLKGHSSFRAPHRTSWDCWWLCITALCLSLPQSFFPPSLPWGLIQRVLCNKHSPYLRVCSPGNPACNISIFQCNSSQGTVSGQIRWCVWKHFIFFIF